MVNVLPGSLGATVVFCFFLGSFGSENERKWSMIIVFPCLWLFRGMPIVFIHHLVDGEGAIDGFIRSWVGKKRKSEEDWKWPEAKMREGQKSSNVRWANRFENSVSKNQTFICRACSGCPIINGKDRFKDTRAVVEYTHRNLSNKLKCGSRAFILTGMTWGLGLISGWTKVGKRMHDLLQSHSPFLWNTPVMYGPNWSCDFIRY